MHDTANQNLAEPLPIREWEAVDRDIFISEIISAGQPAILRGIAASWPCVAVAKSGPEALASYMLQFDKAKKATVFLAKPEEQGRYFYRDDMAGFNFERRDINIAKTIAKLLEISGETEPMGIYAGAGSSIDLFPGFGAENTMPLVDASVVPLVWISNSAKIAPHYDASDNIAVTVSGKRRFLLFPPEQVRNLYVGPLEYNMAGQPASMVDPAKPDLERFPKYQEAVKHALQAEMEPGDAIYIPAMWWHHVRSEGPFNMLVNYWWGNDTTGSGIEALVHAMMSLGDLPAHQKKGWQAMFEHYVFDGDKANIADHLPEHVQGVLGPATPARDRKILEFLKANLDRH